MMFFSKKITVLFLLMLCSTGLFAVKDLGEIATELEGMIYDVLPRDKGEAYFKEAVNFATSGLLESLLQELRGEYSSSFAKSFVAIYVQQFPHLQRPTPSASQQQDMQDIVQQEVEWLLAKNQEQHQQLLFQSLNHCKKKIATDSVILMAAGEDATYSVSSTMPGTTKCLKENSQLFKHFSQDLQATSELLEKQLNQYVEKL